MEQFVELAPPSTEYLEQLTSEKEKLNASLLVVPFTGLLIVMTGGTPPAMTQPYTNIIIRLIATTSKPPLFDELFMPVYTESGV
jgi:hypothetical protein